jgi:uncharacterized SAM-binding protein YcdF (DUF218 family)
MVTSLWLKALLKALVLPPAGPLLLAAIGLVIARRHPRRGRAVATLGIGLLWLLATPVIAFLLLRSLAVDPPLDVEQARTAQAIVVLGGGTRSNALEYGGDTVGRLTLERVRYGAWVAKRTGLPVLVAGGVTDDGEAEATLMAQVLAAEFGVPVRWIEPESMNTHENAARSTAILRRDGIDRIVLVAHGFDMPRARAEFAAQGMAVVPAPTGIPSDEPDAFLDWLPSMAGLQGSYYALYEWLGLAMLRITNALG